MAVKTFTPEELQAAIGQELGVSEWHEVKQAEINAFADCTHDHQWIHIDPERAKTESPFGGPIAHGYYTLSCFPYLLEQIYAVSGVVMGVNYGLNRLRFPSPVMIGSKMRARAVLQSIEPFAGGFQVTLNVTIECEGAAKPACVAEAVYRYYV